MYLEDHDLDEVYYEDASPRSQRPNSSSSLTKTTQQQQQQQLQQQQQQHRSNLSTQRSIQHQHGGGGGGGAARLPSSLGSATRGEGSGGWGDDNDDDDDENDGGRHSGNHNGAAHKRPRSFPVHNLNSLKPKTLVPKRPVVCYDGLEALLLMDGADDSLPTSNNIGSSEFNSNNNTDVEYPAEVQPSIIDNINTSFSGYDSTNTWLGYSAPGAPRVHDNNKDLHRNVVDVSSSTFGEPPHRQQLQQQQQQQQQQSRQSELSHQATGFSNTNPRPNCNNSIGRGSNNKQNYTSSSSTSSTSSSLPNPSSTTKSNYSQPNRNLNPPSSKLGLIDLRPAHWLENKARRDPTPVVRKPLVVAATNSNSNNSGSRTNSGSSYKPVGSRVNSGFVSSSSSNAKPNSRASMSGADVSFKPSWLAQSSKSQQYNSSKYVINDVIEEDTNAEDNHFDNEPIDVIAGVAASGSYITNRNSGSSSNLDNPGTSQVTPSSRAPNFRSTNDDSKARSRSIDEQADSSFLTANNARSRSPVSAVAYTTSHSVSPGVGFTSKHDNVNSNSSINNNSSSSSTSYNNKAALMSSPGMKKPLIGGLREKLGKMNKNHFQNVTKLRVGHAGSNYGTGIGPSFDLADPRNRADYWISIRVDSSSSQLLLEHMLPTLGGFDFNSLSFDSSLIYVPATVQNTHYKAARLGSITKPDLDRDRRSSDSDSMQMPSSSLSSNTNLADFSSESNDFDKSSSSSAAGAGGAPPLPIFKNYSIGDVVLVCFREGDLHSLGLDAYIPHLKRAALDWKRMRSNKELISSGGGSVGDSSDGNDDTTDPSYSNWKFYQPIQLAVNSGSSSGDSADFSRANVASTNYSLSNADGNQHTYEDTTTAVSRSLHVVISSLFEAIQD